MPKPRVTGPSDRIVVIGAGLGGLSAALRLAGAGRSVRILEATPGPGGVMSRWQHDGYQFDLGPTVLTMPSLIDDALDSVGESRSDWLDLIPIEPSYRARYADGSVLNSYRDPARMAAEIGAACGAAEARGYLRLVDYLSELFRVEYDAFMDRNLDSVLGLFRPEAVSLLRLGGLRSLDAMIRRFVTDDRVVKLFTFQSLYAGVAPTRARALYGVISYLDSVSGVWFPRGGMYQVALALAGAAAKHGVQISFETTADEVEISGGRAVAVRTTDGERIPADVVVINADVATAYRQLLPEGMRPWQLIRARPSPSALVWHLGSSGRMPEPAHHTITFGAKWGDAFRDVIGRGRLMSDPSLLITNPSLTDPGQAPPQRQNYYVLAPVPNTHTGRIRWTEIAPRYAAELAAVLRARGFDTDGAFSSGIEVQRIVSPAEWTARGLGAGSPFGLAHTIGQTGPLRHPTQHPWIENLLFCGAGVQPGVGVPTVLLSGRLAAARITG
jgi:phytoene desaturase